MKTQAFSTNEQTDTSILIDRDEFLAHKYSMIAEAFVNTNNLDKDDFFEGVFQSIFTLIPEAQKGSFYELKGELFRPIYSRGYDMNLLKHLVFSKEDTFIDFESHDEQNIDAYEIVVKKREDEKFTEETIHIFKELGTYENFISLYAPIRNGEEKCGLICIENFEQQHYSKNAKILLKIYAQLISNFYSLRLYQQREREKYRDIINSLVSAIEVKDKYTEGHAKRVAWISNKIAIELRIPKYRREMIETAAILHDVGKIGIPTEILTKEAKLTVEEYELVKRHPEDTRKILENIQGFEEIVDIACMHHEHYDGTGYPKGLNGQQLPMEAQIIQAADAYDAMTSDRSYRSAMATDTVRRIFEQQCGKQFHPEVADVIIRLFLNVDKAVCS